MSKISPIVRQTEIQAIALDNQERYLIPLLSGLFALVVTALFVTVASAALVVKLSELSFVTADEWTFFNVMSLLAFANQLSGMASVSTISMNTIYQVSYHNHTYTHYIIHVHLYIFLSFFLELHKITNI